MLKCNVKSLKERYDKALVTSNPFVNPESFWVKLKPLFFDMGFEDTMSYLRFKTDEGGSIKTPVCVRKQGERGCNAVGVSFKRNPYKELAPRTVPRGKVSQLQKHMEATGADIGFAVGEVKKRPYEPGVDIIHVFKNKDFQGQKIPVREVTVPFGKISEEKIKEICNVMGI